MIDDALATAVADGLPRLAVRMWPERACRPGADLLRAGAGVAGEMARRGWVGQAVGAVLDTSWDALAFLVGAVLAGVRLGSLPEPGRATPPDEHLAFLRRIAGALDLAAVVTRTGVGGTLAFADLTGRAPAEVPIRGGFELVQFTSGSTSEPKGVVLGQSRVIANLRALIPAVVDGDLVAVSWLPLSHDMGLIGTTLLPMVAAGPTWIGSATLALIPPRDFACSPGRWLDTCAELGATLTAAPDFAYRMVTPLVRRTHDLSRLRCAATGAEPVRASTLRGFEAAAAGAGLSPLALRPCYGLAEATLAVAMTPLDRSWQARRFSADELHAGRALEVGAGEDVAATEVVAVGRPLPGFEVRVRPLHTSTHTGRGDAVGVVEVRGPSLLDGYTDGGTPLDEHGWFATADLGTVADGELHVVGRRDDVLVVAGRQHHAHDLEDAAAGAGVRPGAVVVVRGRGGGPVVLYEPVDRHAAAVTHAVAGRVLDACGVAPEAVVGCVPGSLPRTPSGKPRRRLAERRWRDGVLPVLPSPAELPPDRPDEHAAGTGDPSAPARPRSRRGD